MRHFRIMPLLASVACAALLASCGDEADPEIVFHDPTQFFVPADSASDSTSALRRQFYDEYGSYLLFNDTLQYSFLGYDANGEARYFVETLDMTYSVGQTNYVTMTYSYTYLEDYAQRVEATEFLKKFLLVHFSDKLRPFSWFLAKSITGKKTTGSTVKPYALSGQRSIAISCETLPKLKTDAQKQQLATRQLIVVIGALANAKSEYFGDFYAVGGQYYGVYTGETDNAAVSETLRQHGFISPSASFKTYYPSRAEDLNAFATLAVSYDDATIEKLYGKYPLVLQKLEIVKSVLTELGYIF